MTLEDLEDKWGPLMFGKCCRYWPIHTSHFARSKIKCVLCKQEVKIVTDEQEIQRLRHTATELSEGPSVRGSGGEHNPGVFERLIGRFVRNKNRQVQEWPNGGGNAAGPRSPWELD